MEYGWYWDENPIDALFSLNLTDSQQQHEISQKMSKVVNSDG